MHKFLRTMTAAAVAAAMAPAFAADATYNVDVVVVGAGAAGTAAGWAAAPACRGRSFVDAAVPLPGSTRRPGGSSALPSRPRPAGRFLLRTVHKAQPGQGSGVDIGAGEYSRLHRGRLCPVQWAGIYGLWADRRAAAGQRHRRAAHCGNGKQPCRRRAAPGVPLCTGAGAVLYPPWLCKTGRVRPLCAREMLKLLAQRTQ